MSKTPAIERGMTLLEALVVLALFGLIVVGTLPLIRLATSQLARAETQGDASVARDQLDRVLTHLVARAQPPTLSSAPGETYVLAGDARLLRFVAPAPEALGGAMTTYELAIEGPSGAQSLALNWQSPGGPQSVVLLRDLTRASFAYLAKAEPVGEAAIWRDAIDGRDTRVGAVRLMVTSESIGVVDRIVPLLIDRNRDCVFDTIALDCR